MPHRDPATFAISMQLTAAQRLTNRPLIPSFFFVKTSNAAMRMNWCRTCTVVRCGKAALTIISGLPAECSASRTLRMPVASFGSFPNTAQICIRTSTVVAPWWRPPQVQSLHLRAKKRCRPKRDPGVGTAEVPLEPRASLAGEAQRPGAAVGGSNPWSRAPCSIRVQRVEDVSQLIRRVHDQGFVSAAVRVGANHLGQGGGLAHGSRHRHSLLTAVSRLQFLLNGFCLIALPITHHGSWALGVSAVPQ
jgi:hypothetical protein